MKKRIVLLSMFVVYSMGQFSNDHPIMAADAYPSQVESYPGGYWEQYALNKLSLELRQKYYPLQKENGYCLANAALEYYVNKRSALERSCKKCVFLCKL